MEREMETGGREMERGGERWRRGQDGARGERWREIEQEGERWREVEGDEEITKEQEREGWWIHLLTDPRAHSDMFTNI